jgi:hypothetical protein
MTRVIVLGTFSRVAINLAALCASQPTFMPHSIIVPRFDTFFPMFLLERWLKNQNVSFGQKKTESFRTPLGQKVESKRILLPRHGDDSSSKRSCYENTSGRRVGRRNGSR